VGKWGQGSLTMEVFRAENPIVVHRLKDKLMSITMEELCERMIATPKKTFVVIVIDGDKVVGHTVAVVGQNKKIVYILSTGIDKDVKVKYKNIAIDMIEKWCIEEFNVHEIRTDTKIKPEFFSRLFKDYKLYGYIMNKTF